MKEIRSGISLLFLIQGVGGIINRLAGAGKSWFIVNYIEALQGWEIVANIVLIIIGGWIGLSQRRLFGTSKKQ